MFKYDVSVIVPVYNSEKYIEECIQSIMTQNYDTKKIQVIIINDGSTDNSEKVCKKIVDKYSNIVLINEKNAGVSEARNAGMKLAEGKYILFLDSDDILKQNSLKYLIEFFDTHYDEVDLVTYPMIVYENEGAKPKQHYRYKLYTDGTGVYDLEDNPYLGQSTINTIIKNVVENRPLFDKEMDYSEDEAFNTSILMEKKKIGFCKEAKYIYRKHVASVTKNKSNPYYTFESLVNYNEKLIEKFQDESGNIPKYIQVIILNNIRWRIKSDEIFPYHYDKEKFEESVQRIKRNLTYVENGVILNMPAMSIYHKFYVFKLKEIELEACYGENIFTIMSENRVLYGSSKVELAFSRLKILDNREVYMLGCIKSPICEMIKPRLFIKCKTDTDEIIEEEIELKESLKSHYQSDIKTNTFYQFEYTLKMDKIKRFEFYILAKNAKLNAEYYFSDISIFNAKLKRYKVMTQDKKYILHYKKKLNVFAIKKTEKKDIVAMKRYNQKLYANINSGINIFRLAANIKSHQEIWLYYDPTNMYDNGYYQFKHDIQKKDGIKRYYVYAGDVKKVNEKFLPKERKYLIKFGSLKHKIYFLSAKKILTSDISSGIYCPFKKNLIWYRDILNYELIYLQHGVLYAKLLRMYGKEFTDVSKVVISSEFEKKNLIENYKYKEEDLICAGMPRFDIEKRETKENKTKEDRSIKKIIYAPSWRKYLVGELVNRTRLANMPEMLKSSFYQENIEFLTSERLQKVLEDNNVVLEFKLHPNFACYKKLFQEGCKGNIHFSEDEVSPQKYDALITDYSSFQFDFIRHMIPIIYFVPDLPEFKAGLHTYRELDLPLEEAFGDVTYEVNELINKIEYYVTNNFEVEEKYRNKMENFFFETNNNREKIYQVLKEK